jgi:uncharacterized membrane-anchored protein
MTVIKQGLFLAAAVFLVFAAKFFKVGLIAAAAFGISIKKFFKHCSAFLAGCSYRPMSAIGQ